ncbi:hypothetical protein BDV93DRAFT_548378 [Ceratobasidium sp. AG-I]|nr:hypothetical protein BDV93DRAFT_548378 [Ceratobasidium sp. AG-I]
MIALTRVTAAVLAFTVVADALTVSASRGTVDVDAGVGELVKLRLPTASVDGILDDSRIELRTRSASSDSSSPSADSTSINSKIDHAPLRTRSYPGPRRLDSDPPGPYERRSHHARHRKHGEHGKHRHHTHSRDSKYQATQANGTGVVAPTGGNMPAPLPSAVARRGVYVSTTDNGPSIHIRPLSYYVQDTSLLTRELSARGLLDPVMPILDDLLPPGLRGIIELVPELLNGLLGPVLGDLVISPNKAAAHAAEDGNGKGTLDSESQYVLAAAKSNPSTIWLVDTGKPVPASSDSLSTSSTSPKEKMVSLQMAFVDTKTGEYESYCATYERDPERPVSLGVVPCEDANPAESQMFAYDPETSVLRAIWDDEKSEGEKKKRHYFVGGGTGHKGDVETEGAGAGGMVVMVFQALNSTNGPVTVHTIPGTSNSTIPANGSVLDAPAGPAHGFSADEKNSTSPVTTQDEASGPANGKDDDMDLTKSVANIPAAAFVPGEQFEANVVSVLGAEANEAVTANLVEGSDTPVFVAHELDSMNIAAATSTPAA